MKISTIALAVLGFIQPSVEANESGCVTTVEQGKDYFPIKSTVENSELWTVTYSDTYKIVTNLALSETYVLYQCGTEVPEDIPNNGTFSVPLEKLGLLSTTYIPFFEMLGARDSIGTFLSPAAWVSSPCMLELFDQGVIGEVENVYNETTLDAETMVLPSFVYSYGGFSTPLSNEIIVSEFEEKSNLAVFEWIKFFALFLNLEEEANEIFAATKSRFECATENAGYLACDDKPKPVVLWGHYSAYCGGWDVATCPNYYCEFASSCQAEIRNPEDRGSVVSEACGANYMTTEEFVAFGKDADVWIYPNNDFDSTLSEFGDAIADFVSVKNEKVFDNLGSGDNAWYEQRLAEPDVILQDFCAVVGSENMDAPVRHTRAWLRNVFSEAVGSLGACQDTSAPLIARATECLPVAADYCETKDPNPNPAEDPTADEPPAEEPTDAPVEDSASQAGVIVSAVLAAAAFLV